MRVDVIIDVDVQTGTSRDLSEFPNSTQLPRVHQDEAGDLVYVDVFDPLGLKNIQS